MKPLLAGLKVAAIALSTSAIGLTQPPIATFRDLNHNGRLDVYEDARRTAAERLDDLLAQMTLEEKVGTLLHISPPADDQLGRGRRYDLTKLGTIIADTHVSSLITRLATSPREMAEQNNAVQPLAEASRLGIPMTVSTDPRNHFQAVLGASTAGGGFSLWPETLGFAALRDPATVRRFADIARREYRRLTSPPNHAGRGRRRRLVPIRSSCRGWCRLISKGSRAGAAA